VAERIRFVDRAGSVGLVFLFAYVGAAVYFVSRSDGTFLAVVLGLVKAVVWPAYVVYHGLDALAV
jgi:hypothetical protein